MLNVCLICSALLIVKVIFVITVFFSFLCVSTILANKDDHWRRSGKGGSTASTGAARVLSPSLLVPSPKTWSSQNVWYQ